MAEEKRYRVIIEGDASPLKKAGKEADAIVDKINNRDVEIEFNIDRSDSKVSAFLSKLRSASKEFKKENEITIAQINMDRLDALETKLATIKKLQEDLSGNDVESGKSLGLQESQNVRKRLQGYDEQLNKLKDNPLEYSKMLREALSYIENIPEEFKSRYGKLVEGIRGRSKGILDNYKPEDLLGIDPKLLDGDRKKLEDQIKKKTDSLIKKTENDLQRAKKDFAKSPSDSLPKAHENRVADAEAKRIEAEQKAREEAEKKAREAEETAQKERLEKEKAAEKERLEQEEKMRQEAEAVQNRKHGKEGSTLDNVKQDAKDATDAINETKKAIEELEKAKSKSDSKVADSKDTEKQQETIKETKGLVEDLEKKVNDTPKADTSIADSMTEVGSAAEKAGKNVDELQAKLKELKGSKSAIESEISSLTQRQNLSRRSLLDSTMYSITESPDDYGAVTASGKTIKETDLKKGAKYDGSTGMWNYKGKSYYVKSVDGNNGTLEKALAEREQLVGKLESVNKEIAEIESLLGAPQSQQPNDSKAIENAKELAKAEEQVAESAKQANDSINESSNVKTNNDVEQQANKNVEAINKEKQAIQDASEEYKKYSYYTKHETLDKYGNVISSVASREDRSRSYDEIMEYLQKRGYTYDEKSLRWKSSKGFKDLLIERNPKVGNDPQAIYENAGLLTDGGYIEPDEYHKLADAQREAAAAAKEAAEAEQKKNNAVKEGKAATEQATKAQDKNNSSKEEEININKLDVTALDRNKETGKISRSGKSITFEDEDDFKEFMEMSDLKRDEATGLYISNKGNGKKAYDVRTRRAYDRKTKEGLLYTPKGSIEMDDTIKQAREQVHEGYEALVEEESKNTQKKIRQRRPPKKPDNIGKEVDNVVGAVTDAAKKDLDEITTAAGDKKRKRKTPGKGNNPWEFLYNGEWQTLDEIAVANGLKKEALDQRMRKGLSIKEALSYTGHRGRPRGDSYDGRIASTEGRGTSDAKEARKSQGKNARRADESLSAEDLVAREQALESAEENIKRQAKAAGEIITGVTNFYDSADNLVKQQVKTRGLDVDDAIGAVIQDKTYTTEYGFDTGEAFTSHIDSNKRIDKSQFQSLRELGDILTSDQALFDRFGESYREFYDKVLSGDMSGASKLGKDLKSQVETYQAIEQQREAISKFGEELKSDDDIFRQFGDSYQSLLDSLSNAKSTKDVDAVSKRFEQLKSRVSDSQLEKQANYSGSRGRFEEIGNALKEDSDLMDKFGESWRQLLVRLNASGDLDSNGLKMLGDDIDRLWDKVKSHKSEKLFDEEKLIPLNTINNIRNDLKAAGVDIEAFEEKLNKSIGFNIGSVTDKINQSSYESGFGDINKMIAAIKSEATRAIKDSPVGTFEKQANEILKFVESLNKSEPMMREFGSEYDALVDRLNEPINADTTKDIEKEFKTLKDNVASRKKELEQEAKPDKASQDLSAQILGVSDDLLKYEERAKELGSVSAEVREDIQDMFTALKIGGIDTKSIDYVKNHIKEIGDELTRLEAKQKTDGNRLVREAQSGLKFLNTRDTTKYTQDVYEEMKRLKNIISGIDLNNIDFGNENAMGKIKEFVSGIELFENSLKSLDKQVAKSNSIKNLDKQMAQFADKNHRLTQEMVSDIERYREMLQKPGLTKGEYNNVFGMFRELESGAIDQGLVGGVSALENLTNRIKQMNTNFIGMYFSFYDIVRYAKEIGQTVTEINSAQTELRKVSDASQTRIQENFKTSAETAQEMGATISDVIASTSDWARLGYSVDDAEVLARNTALYQSVGDNMTQESASEYLTSIMKGYQLDADQSESIIDKVNEVANNYSIDTQGLGEALQRSASAFNTAHTDLDKSIAIITASNEVLQDPEKVGTMWNTSFLLCWHTEMCA